MPIGAQISAYTTWFREPRRRIADMEDALAEWSEFELPVPILELPDDSSR